MTIRVWFPVFFIKKLPCDVCTFILSHQFVLDMQFIIEMASHGRYLTRRIKAVIADIITRAVEAFSRTGLDPDR